ncbi:flagellar basal body P-ring formation chaperone FlgA [Neptuniibacter halophilus]|uniref:flagellar basal body P-ring formation chaperone FlgA n=1 Tax=Neptuniibacter halophilus TaxID=651666 RepID=UPI002572AC2B|nr:flagellar basal body P-ring formation chaperone FlgA [Neptuniibacter halophilus]
MAPIRLFAADQTDILEQEAVLFLQEHYKKAQPDARTEIKLNPISRKIKLKNCQAPLEFQTPRGNSSRITFRARCPAPGWQLFIAAEVKHFGPAVVSNISLPRNAQLRLSNLTLEEVDLTTLRSAYFTRPADIKGWTTKRSIPAGSVITASMLKAPLAISQGNAVIIEAKRNSVTIRASGTALEDGEVGEQIRIQNDRSGNIIKARVIGPGLVRAP